MCLFDKKPFHLPQVAGAPGVRVAPRRQSSSLALLKHPNVVMVIFKLKGTKRDLEIVASTKLGRASMPMHGAHALTARAWIMATCIDSKLLEFSSGAGEPGPLQVAGHQQPI